MEAKEIIRIGVTGHRNISSEQSLALEPVIKKTIENITRYHRNNFYAAAPVKIISSIAEGADTIVANVAIKYFDCKLQIILPFKKEEYIKDFTSEQKKKEFQHLLNSDAVSEILCLGDIDKTERQILYLDAGKKMIDASDYIIAIWNEEKAKGVGGTGDIIDYAISLKKDILVINPFDEVLKIKGDYFPEFYKESFKKIISENLNFNPLENLFNCYDREALQNQKKYKKIWKQCFNLGLITALVFSIEIAFFQSKPDTRMALILNCAALVCIVLISYLVYNEKKRSLHRNYLTNRYIAERLRIENTFFKCGYQQDKISNSGIYSAVSEFDSLSPLIISNKLLQLCCYSDAAFTEKENITISLLNEQVKYHTNRIGSLLKSIHTNKLIVSKLFLVFLVLLAADILNQICRVAGFINMPVFVSEWILFLSLIVPAIIARFEAKKYLSEWEKLVAHSRYMIDYFNKLLAKIKNATNDGELCSIINMVNENMYFENLEWEMFMLTKNEILQ